MEPRLTEFSYGYCVTEEFANGLGPGLKAAPYFPSLYVEGKVGGGFDVRIDSALFLQFKLCEELTRRTAFETKERLLQPTFYRFWLHRRDRSSQHQMLIDLENETGNQVYYIAPGFAAVENLDQAYTSGLVIERSAMFSPRQIGPQGDDRRHRVAFRPDEDWGWFLSEPKRITIHRKGEVLERSRSGRFAENKHELQDWLAGLAERMVSIINRHHAEEFTLIDSGARVFGPQKDPLERVAYLARTHFGCELFLLAEPREQSTQK